MMPAHLPPPPRIEASIAAVVVELQGLIRMEPNQLLTAGHPLPISRRVSLPKGARLSLIHLASGEEWVFTGPCRFHFDAKGCAQGAKPDQRKTLALLRDRYPLNGQELAQAALVLRQGGAANPLGMDPAGPALRQARPSFHWTAPVPSSEYRFSLRDELGHQALSQVVRTSELMLPPNITLQEGVTYSWTVEGPDALGQPSGWSGTFRLLDGAKQAFLASHEPSPSATAAERLAFALLCNQMAAGSSYITTTN